MLSNSLIESSFLILFIVIFNSFCSSSPLPLLLHHHFSCTSRSSTLPPQIHHTHFHYVFLFYSFITPSCYISYSLYILLSYLFFALLETLFAYQSPVSFIHFHLHTHTFMSRLRARSPLCTLFTSFSSFTPFLFLFFC